VLPAPNNRDHDLDHMNGVIVIVAYRPKPGKEKETLELVRNRVPTLLKEGLVTDRAPTIMRAGHGTIIEVSEWKSHEAIDAAHKNPIVLAMWNKFFAVCDCVPLKTLVEAEEMFAGFEPIAG
jgi:quinol monooxygenase YgiN